MESVLGVLGLIAFCAAVIALAAGITFLVIKLTPTQRKKKTAESATS